MSEVTDIDRLDDYIQGIGGITAAGRKLDVVPSTIHRWINGDVKIPGIMLANLKLSDKIKDQYNIIETKNRIIKELQKELEQQ